MHTYILNTDTHYPCIWISPRNYVCRYTHKYFHKRADINPRCINQKHTSTHEYKASFWNIEQVSGISSKLLEYRASFWNIEQVSGISSKFLEYRASFWNIEQVSGISSKLLEYRASFWNIEQREQSEDWIKLVVLLRFVHIAKAPTESIELGRLTLTLQRMKKRITQNVTGNGCVSSEQTEISSGDYNNPANTTNAFILPAKTKKESLLENLMQYQLPTDIMTKLIAKVHPRKPEKLEEDCIIPKKLSSLAGREFISLPEPRKQPIQENYYETGSESEDDVLLTEKIAINTESSKFCMDDNNVGEEQSEDTTARRPKI
ncbi:BMA-RHA-2 [Dirofilaria immitis]|nr:BMA-RHA-2 [Dirofilaria immitis]